MANDPVNIPRVGMLATVRNRRGVITAVNPYDGGPSGRHHLVRVEYSDRDGASDEHLIWELEPHGRLLEQAALPAVQSAPPMAPRDFDAVVRSARWTSISPFIDPDGAAGPLNSSPIAAPFHGAIQVDDFQLVPLIKALRMPRIAMLLADDVGLGKTIEAGLILTELLIRRRIQRVLVLCPASLQTQWQGEMSSKFSVDLDVVDRDRSHKLRRRLGLDANPWRSSPRIVTSYHYLKQPDVLADFNAAIASDPASPHLPWDLLIVDEAHNLSPSTFGENSLLTRMLRQITPRFEHRLFLTATPHNGHTQSFSGLLEMLDPVRFTMRDELSVAERSRVSDVLVRRLKREINERTTPPRFAERLPPAALKLQLSPAEASLSAAFSDFRSRVRSVIAGSSRSGRVAGWFAVEILGKRLLSCPLAFADSWRRVRAGIDDQLQVKDAEVLAVERSTREDNSDDREAESRVAHAAKTVGSWLKPLAGRLEPQIRAIDLALSKLGLPPEADLTQTNPTRDARVDALVELIDKRLRNGVGWRPDERLVVFTEYKTTLDYVCRRLLDRFKDESRFVMLFGGMDETERDVVKRAFNDGGSPVRVLLATDAASEGLNLQETARFILHFDVPWNPARLEQRNGRLDRHGQARDVSVFHFASDVDADLQFLAHVVNKLHTIREDLGATAELFDAAIHRRLVEGEAADGVQRELDVRVERARGRANVPRDARLTTTGENERDEGDRLRALAAELDLDPLSLCHTLEVALSVGGQPYRFDACETTGRVKFRPPLPPEWEAAIDSSLRLAGTGQAKGALPGLVFDPAYLIDTSSGRPVFRPRLDTVLMHLSHPLYQRALSTLARARFPGEDANKATRWTVRRAKLPHGTAQILLTLEELAVNELREPFHHWTRTLTLPVNGETLAAALAHAPALASRLPDSAFDAGGTDAAREVWSTVAPDIRKLIARHATELTAKLKRELETRRAAALKMENDRFASRQGEVSELIAKSTLASLEREIAQLKAEKAQGSLYEPEGFLEELDLSIEAKQEELKRRSQHYEELREQLRSERDRVINRIIPKRYALRGDAQVFPVAVEIRLPGGAA